MAIGTIRIRGKEKAEEVYGKGKHYKREVRRAVMLLKNARARAIDGVVSERVKNGFGKCVWKNGKVVICLMTR